jgi:hypothetical protein
LAVLLVEFNKHIALLEADCIVFMARKVLRLYDLLVMAGGPLCRSHVDSDHVLEQSPEIFAGKTICLIDDTLILGTTLGAAKRTLLRANAKKVTCHVIAVDQDNWCRDLVDPEPVMSVALQQTRT